MKTKKIPMRMCLGCNEMKPKKEMIRVVKSPEGEISLDFTGKKSGRGAYICKNKECYEKAIKSKRLSRSLEIEIPDSIYEEIKAEILKNE